ncbi:hypothetical protein [Cupriavidus sp. D39]|uniref:hypothetical protein n=1 Tax=Cupriavidus sp. D39 TaxID=2997877 RepID=UPI0022721917|nr:hypothetical protein [Cupriavidus sp. D39]MCY0856025.1 hypothetical protein [Cupriavidus sp. D39]
MEAEHGVAKKATDSAGRPVASGLHTFANIDGMASKANKWKRTSFDDLRDRRQRSANRYPMGAFDAYPTEYEWSLIADQCADRPETMTFDGVEFVDVIEGTDMETLLETLRLDLDRKARAHESHVGTLSKLARNTKGLRRGTKARWAAKVNMPEVAPVDVPAMIERRTEEVCNMVVLLIAAQAMMQGFDLTAVAANDEQMKEAA